MAVYRPEDLHPATLEALNAGDIDAVIGLYEPGASMTLQPDTFVEGLDGIRDIWNGFLAVNGKMTVEVTKLVQTGDLALSQSNWSVVGTGPDGSAVEMGGKATEVSRRQPDGSWLWVIDLA